MIYRYLGNYDEFKCIADKCLATCCSGWAVEIDEKSLEEYRRIADSDRDDLLNSCVNWEEACFESQENGACSCLDENGLCKLFIAHGEDSLCVTCDQYPRHIEEFPNTREYSLSVSCPVVAKALLEMDEAFEIVTVQDESEEDMYEAGTLENDEPVEKYPDFDDEMYNLLLENREEILKIIGDKTKNIDARCQEILERMKRVQGEYDGADDSGMEYISCMSAEEAFNLFLELEPLQPEFRQFVEKARTEVEKSDFEEKLEAFRNAHIKWDIWFENIMTYFLFTYMCGAVYDEYIFSMTAQAVYNTRMIFYLWTVRWTENPEETMDMNSLAQILFSYSRELEHSNENMILLEQLIEENA